MIQRMAHYSKARRLSALEQAVYAAYADWLRTPPTGTPGTYGQSLPQHVSASLDAVIDAELDYLTTQCRQRTKDTDIEAPF